ncbi:hypothetical protein [Pseudoalteromonas piscicida]|nr:hypothetical protein [Pseudoalteromonas piscicida]
MSSLEKGKDIMFENLYDKYPQHKAGKSSNKQNGESQKEELNGK